MFTHLSKPIVNVLWAVVALAGLLAGWMGYDGARKLVLAELNADAVRCAAAFDPENVRQLAGTRADLTTPAYIAMKRRLMRLQAATPRVRFIYVFRFLPETGKVIFLGDSAVPGAADESLPGDYYP